MCSSNVFANEAQLPSGKTVSNFDFSHCPKFNPASLMQLADDPSWLTRAENLLLFGASGVGKSHLTAAVSRRMIAFGKQVNVSSG
ncbi:ATP-binding protein [Leptolyngbya sp. FACHB-321]|nr:ATP-binding protein [Leptolyngbya sp. FACHB-321]